MTFKILSLDGGGIRGVLSARILKEVETTIRNTTRQELHDYFDLITGTSTGSILAAGIACKMNAQQMIDIYLEEGENIFLKSVRKHRKRRFFGLLLGDNPITKIINKPFGWSLFYPHEKGEKGLAKILQKKLIHPKLGALVQSD